MLSDVITLSVDTQNDGVGPVSEEYNRFEENLNRSIYVGEDHQLIDRNTLTFYRTQPKVAGNFRGVAKTSFKFSKDFAVTGVDGVASITAPVIVEVSFSIPVGVTAADQLHVRQRVLALLDLDSVMVPLNNQLMI